MMKVVLKLEYHDDKIKKKAIQKSSCISGDRVNCSGFDGQKVNVAGNFDPVSVVKKLRKFYCAYKVSFGPAKEPEKKKEKPKKKEPKKTRQRRMWPNY